MYQIINISILIIVIKGKILLILTGIDFNVDCRWVKSCIFKVNLYFL